MMFSVRFSEICVMTLTITIKRNNCCYISSTATIPVSKFIFNKTLLSLESEVYFLHSAEKILSVIEGSESKMLLIGINIKTAISISSTRK